MAELNVSAEQLLEYMKWWIQAHRLGSSDVEPVLRNLEQNVEYFEAGGTFTSKFEPYPGLKESL